MLFLQSSQINQVGRVQLVLEFIAHNENTLARRVVATIEREPADAFVGLWVRPSGALHHLVTFGFEL